MERNQTSSIDSFMNLNEKGEQQNLFNKKKKLLQLIVLEAQKKEFQRCNNIKYVFQRIKEENCIGKYLRNTSQLLNNPRNSTELKNKLFFLDPYFNFSSLGSWDSWLKAFQQLKKEIQTGTTNTYVFKPKIGPDFYKIQDLPKYYDQAHSFTILDYFGKVKTQEQIYTKFIGLFDKIQNDIQNKTDYTIIKMISGQVFQISELLKNKSKKNRFLELAMYMQGLQYWKNCNTYNKNIDKKYRQLQEKADFKYFSLNLLLKKLTNNISHKYNITLKFLNKPEFKKIKLTDKQEESLEQLCRFKILMGYYGRILEEFYCYSLDDLKNIDLKPIMKKMLTMCTRAIMFKIPNSKNQAIDHKIHLKFEKAAKFYIENQLYLTPKNIVIKKQNILSKRQTIKDIRKIFSQNTMNHAFSKDQQLKDFINQSKSEKVLLPKTK